MRASFLMLCLAASVARAQAPAGGSSEVEGTEVKQPPAPGQNGQVRTAPPGPDQGPSTVHTVEKGDTLWDLSSKYLGSPWYWPKVWSYNPQIANPHWIYPGNQVRFFPGNGEETPVQGRAGDRPTRTRLPGRTRSIGGDDEVQMVRLPVEVKTGEIVLRDGFVTPNEVEAAGTLVGELRRVGDALAATTSSTWTSRTERGPGGRELRRVPAAAEASTTRAAGSSSAT